MREAAYLVNYADDDAYTLVAGDFIPFRPMIPIPQAWRSCLRASELAM
jgi:hypothetical protein